MLQVDTVKLTNKNVRISFSQCIFDCSELREYILCACETARESGGYLGTIHSFKIRFPFGNGNAGKKNAAYPSYGECRIAFTILIPNHILFHFLLTYLLLVDAFRSANQ